MTTESAPSKGASTAAAPDTSENWKKISGHYDGAAHQFMRNEKKPIQRMLPRKVQGKNGRHFCRQATAPS